MSQRRHMQDAGLPPVEISGNAMLETMNQGIPVLSVSFPSYL